MIDTVNLYLPCDLRLGLPIHEGSLYKELNSGILWNAAFGEINDPTYNWIEWEGLPNIGERLKKQGILKSDQFEELRAIAFIVHSSTDRKIIGFHRARERDKVLLEILYKICDFVNDEFNSHYWNLEG